MRISKLFIGVFILSLFFLEQSINAATLSFKDIDSKNPYYEEISLLTSKGIISGYEDGTFKPNATITRKQAAAMINRGVDLKNTISSLHQQIDGYKYIAPKDVKKGNPYYEDIKALLEAGILGLDKKDNFYPNKPLTRGEMAILLINAYELVTEQEYEPFSDVTSKYRIYAMVLHANNISTGYEDGTFQENEPLTRAHFSKFIYRAMNIEKFISPEKYQWLKEIEVERRSQAEKRIEILLKYQ